jgi:hypothetical protein
MDKNEVNKDDSTNILDDFSSQDQINANESFLNSNSIIAKFSFVILIVIGFVILLNLGIKLIFYLFQPSRTTYIVNGLVDGKANLYISQNPKVTKQTIVRSNNETSGLEFTWSVWLYINDADTTTWNHIFHKGNMNFQNAENINGLTGMSSPNNAPGVYVVKDDSDSILLTIIMDSITGGAFNIDNNENVFLDIYDIPIKKWFHLAIRIQNTVMDAYINGVISGRITFTNVPKQNYNDIYVGCNGGFNGSLSNLVYYDHALTVFDINNIILKNPNLTKSSSANSSYGFYSYISSNWYTLKM